MLYTILMVVFLVVALLLLAVAFKLLIKISWFAGWLRGNIGMAVLLLSVGVAIAAYDFRTFTSYKDNQQFLTVSLQSKGNDQYIATFAGKGSKQFEHLLSGSTWRLEADTINWSRRLQSMGFSGGYRLDSLQLDPAGSSEKSALINLQPEAVLGIDVVNVLELTQGYLPTMSAGKIKTDILPLIDGAIFDLSISENRILASPVNAIAKNALEAP